MSIYNAIASMGSNAGAGLNAFAQNRYKIQQDQQTREMQADQNAFTKQKYGDEAKQKHFQQAVQMAAGGADDALILQHLSSMEPVNEGERDFVLGRIRSIAKGEQGASGRNIVGSPQKLGSGNLGFLNSQGEIVDTGVAYANEPPQFVSVAGIPYVFNKNTGQLEPVSVGGERLDAPTVGGHAGTVAGGEAAGRAAIAMSQDAIQQVANIRKNIANYVEAENAIRAGASTGAIMSRLPSIRAQSIALDNVRSRLGLDIVGSVTFGALSEPELRLALDTGLPTNMEPEYLLKWIDDRKKAQTKLMNELEHAAVFLGTPGNTPADYLEMKGVKKPSGRRTVETSNGSVIIFED
jgi:hypothetical protein